MSIVRRVGRRLGVLLLALLATCGLLNANSAPAHADTGNSRWTVIPWYVSDLDGEMRTPEGAARYRDFITSLRTWAGHQINNQNVDRRLWETETIQNHFIEVQVWTGPNQDQLHLTLYFRTNDLYLVGFGANSQRWQFGDAGGDRSALARAWRDQYNQAGRFNDLGYDENYNSLDPNRERGDMVYTPWYLHNQLMSFQGINRQTANNYRLRLAYIAQATAEAARTPWIFNRIHETIRDGESSGDDSGRRYTYVGSFGMALENQWSNLSRLIYRVMRGQRVDPVDVDGRRYRNIDDIVLGDPTRPQIGALLANSAQMNR
ncbi:ribosome-inactivating family protein [Streptomyces chrestomyceticus]|uniref:ribosome-inactivating family protein n=1 Tax=Streptomyces chrestomyceticus TaxID=68185 RepID=UPI0033DD58D8